MKDEEMKISLIRQGYEDECWLVSEIEFDGTRGFLFDRNDSECSVKYITNESPTDIEWWDEGKEVHGRFITVNHSSRWYRPAIEIWKEYAEKGKVDIL